MPDAGELGRALIALDVLIVMAGVVLVLAGRLPGDMAIQGEGYSCLIPLATSQIASVLLTVIVNALIRWLNR